MLLFTGLFIAVTVNNARPRGSVCPRSFLLTCDTNGIPHLHGVSLANPYLRRAIFRVISLLGGEVDIMCPRGWMRNPVVRSNVTRAAADVARLGLSAGDRAIVRRNKLAGGEVTFPALEEVAVRSHQAKKQPIHEAMIRADVVAKALAGSAVLLGVFALRKLQTRFARVALGIAILLLLIAFVP